MHFFRFTCTLQPHITRLQSLGLAFWCHKLLHSRGIAKLRAKSTRRGYFSVTSGMPLSFHSIGNTAQVSRVNSLTLWILLTVQWPDSLCTQEYADANCWISKLRNGAKAIASSKFSLDLTFKKSGFYHQIMLDQEKFALEQCIYALCTLYKAKSVYRS